jgi:OOP family OmpA-OmpF porin
MRSSKTLGMAALAAALVAAAPALAQAPAPETAATNNFYAGLTFGQAHWRSGCVSTATNCDDTDRALRVFGGFKLNRILSVEAGFHNLGKATSPIASVKGHAWEAVGLAYWPLAGALSAYGKLGIFRTKIEGGGSLVPNRETNYGPTFGLGLQMELNRNLGLRGEWQSYPSTGGSTLPRSDINVISAGAYWRFL